MLRAVVALLALIAFAWAKQPSPLQRVAAPAKQGETKSLLQTDEVDDEEVDYAGEDEDEDADKDENGEEDEDEDADKDENGEEDENEDEDKHADLGAAFVQLGQEVDQHMVPEPSLAGAWQSNSQNPVWKVLQQQLVELYGQGQLAHYTAVTVPATLVYAMSAYEQKILEPARRDGKGELNLHLIGSTYFYEGLSDWSILARASPPDFHTVNVHLILGTPFGYDGKIQSKGGETIHFDKNLDMEQVKLLPTFLQISPNKAYGAKELRSKTCRSFTHGSTTVKVHCHEKLYQNVKNEVPTPHLAFMSNPGFPLPYRRFYDAVLIDLLTKSIPSVISAQQGLTRNKMEELVAAKGDGHAWSIVDATMKNELWRDEAYQCSETVKSYGANVNLQASPFPYAYEQGDDDWTVKNAVIEFFSGRAAGPSNIEMLATPENGIDDEHVIEAEDQEFVSSLRVPVSQPFAQAMRTWAQQEAKGCLHAGTVKDWVECCKGISC